MVSVDKKKRQDLLERMDALDRKVEVSLLGPQEMEFRHCLKGCFERRKFIGYNDRR